MNHRFARLSTALSATVGLALVAGLVGVPGAQAAEPTAQPTAKTLQTKTATLQQLFAQLCSKRE